MMKSPAMKILGSAVWVLSALGAIHVGLMAMNYNLLHSAMLMNFARPLEYIFGIAGVISLIMFAMYGACGCDCGHNHR